MKQKYEVKDLERLAELGREPGHLACGEVNESLPQELSSRSGLSPAIERFQDQDIKVLAGLPAVEMGCELETEIKEESEGGAPQPRRPLIQSASRRIQSASTSKR